MKPRARTRTRRNRPFTLRPGETLEFEHVEARKARVRVIFPPHIRVRVVKRT